MTTFDALGSLPRGTPHIRYRRSTPRSPAWRALSSISFLEFRNSTKGQRPIHLVGCAEPRLAIVYRGQLLEGHDGDALKPLPQVYLSGPWSKGRVMKAQGRTVIAMLGINPSLLPHISGLSSQDIRNTTLPFCGIAPHDVCEQLLEIGLEPYAVVRLLESIAESSDVSSKLSELRIFDILSQGSLGWRVAEYERQLGMSSRTMQRRMLNEFAVTPKQILSSARVNCLLTRVLQNPTNTLSRLSADMDYSDQNHMRRDLAKLNMGSIKALKQETITPPKKIGSAEAVLRTLTDSLGTQSATLNSAEFPG